MAKLYWRVKVGGVWTYKAATIENTALMGGYDPKFAHYREEEEE